MPTSHPKPTPGFAELAAHMATVIKSGRNCAFCKHSCYKIITDHLDQLLVWRKNISSLTPAQVDIEIRWIFGQASRNPHEARTPAADDPETTSTEQSPDGEQSVTETEDSPRPCAAQPSLCKRPRVAAESRHRSNDSAEALTTSTEDSNDDDSLLLEDKSCSTAPAKLQAPRRQYPARQFTKTPSVQLQFILSSQSLFVCRQAALKALGISAQRVRRVSLLQKKLSLVCTYLL
jgi:hypothetical protein